MDQVTKPPVLKTGLYDLSRDPAEARDLSGAHPDKVKELQDLWDKWNAGNVTALWSPDAKAEAPQVPAKPLDKGPAR